jgi:hypothetical protein
MVFNIPHISSILFGIPWCLYNVFEHPLALTINYPCHLQTSSQHPFITQNKKSQCPLMFSQCYTTSFDILTLLSVLNVSLVAKCKTHITQKRKKKSQLPFYLLAIFNSSTLSHCHPPSLDKTSLNLNFFLLKLKITNLIQDISNLEMNV